MLKERVSTAKAPAAIGPYSQAIKGGGLVFVSGQLPLSALTGEIVSGEIKEQTEQVLNNLEQVLKAAGASLGTVVKTTIFLSNMDNFALVNEVYGSYFQDVPPARSTIEVARLPKDALIEIEAVALEER